jgi:tRNA dimethylallyltransferase
MEKGLVQEVKKLVEMGYDNSTIAMQGIGYKEILSYLKGEITLDEAIYVLKRDTRHYAKRQLTWFNRMEDVTWIDIDQNSNLTEIIKNIKEVIATSGIIL